MFLQLLKKIIFNIYLLFIYSSKKPKRYFIGIEKSYLIKILELFTWLLRDSQFNYHYYAFGLNIKGTSQAKFIGKKEFLQLKSHAELKIAQKYGIKNLSYDILTKDKFVNFTYLKSLQIPVIEVRKIIKDQVIDLDGNTYPIESLFELKTSFVLKNITTEYGEDFMLCQPTKYQNFIVNGKLLDLKEFKTKLNKKIWIMQDVIKSHYAIRKINNSALNTTRIVTIFNGEEPVYLSGFQSFATDNQIIDNWGKGAVYVGLNLEKECLKEYGYYHPAIKSHAFTTIHPDSGILFKDYPIPYLKDAVYICIKAHRFLYTHFVIGWDVAITDDGPFILEANEKPGMNAVQVIDGGLRDIVRLYYKKTINN